MKKGMRVSESLVVKARQCKVMVDRSNMRDYTYLVLIQVVRLQQVKHDGCQLFNLLRRRHNDWQINHAVLLCDCIEVMHIDSDVKLIARLL
jgi:hypothetical protein